MIGIACANNVPENTDVIFFKYIFTHQLY
jgi:hypothetical protein